MSTLASFLSGLVFSIGLVISGMIDPQKVLNFLDVAGTFDASLAFVMVGAIAVTFLGYRLALRRAAPLFDARFHYPEQTKIDARLVTGAAIFGVGWGLSGFCPGPALASLALLDRRVVIFVIAMVAGMTLARLVARLR